MYSYCNDILFQDINVWERRAPIAPHHVANLVEKGIDVIVQPSTRRGYTMDEYLNAGAIIQEDLSPASLILAVKQVPFFSSFKKICPLPPLYWLLNRYFFVSNCRLVEPFKTPNVIFSRVESLGVREHVPANTIFSLISLVGSI